MIPVSDMQNYEAFLLGDVGSFESLIIKYRDSLVSFIYRYTKDIHLAQDIAQDTFVEVLLHKERFDHRASFKTYLFTIARNKSVDYIRKNSRYLFVDEARDYLEPVTGIEDVIVKTEEKKELYRVIGQLKLEYQVAITLIDFEEMSYQEAAVVLNKSLGQIKILIHRARKSLAKMIEKEGI